MERLSVLKEKEVIALASSHTRRKKGKIIVEGLRAIETVIQSGLLPDFIVVSPTSLTGEGHKFVATQIAGKFPEFECDENRFKKLTDTLHSQGLLAVVHERFEPITPEILHHSRLGLYLDEINDPGNFGTIIRSATAFRADYIAVSPNSVELANPKVIRASAGLIFSLPIEKVAAPETFFDLLQSNEIDLIGADSAARMELAEVSTGRKVCLAIGSEARGLNEWTRKACQNLFRIRTADSVESLNAASATAIALYYFSTKLKLL